MLKGERWDFKLRIKPMGKERPRVTRNGTFMPKKYEAWREQVRWLIRAQCTPAMLALTPLTGLLGTHLSIHSPHKVTPDGDNAEGAIWDAVQQQPKKKGQASKGWGLIADDKQFKKWGGSIQEGESMIYFSVWEL